MAREKTHLSIALKQGASYVVSRRCVLISLLVVALFSGLLWGIYGPKAPVPTLYQYNTTLATVEKWATPNAKCASGGSARNFTFISASAVDYECQNIRLNKQSFFTILIILGALVLMCASYPTDLTMLGTNVILVATGAISTKEGAFGSHTLSISSSLFRVGFFQICASLLLLIALFLLSQALSASPRKPFSLSRPCSSLSSVWRKTGRLMLLLGCSWGNQTISITQCSGCVSPSRSCPCSC